MIRQIRTVAAALAAIPVLLAPHSAAGQAQDLAPPPSGQAAAASDGQRDFDWEIGTWATHVRVLRNPLSGAAADWADYRGTSVVHAFLDRRANMVELSVEGPAGRIEGLSLRLYNPEARQWSLNFANVRGGVLTDPVYGGFDGGNRGTFYGQEMIGGRPILVRFVIDRISADEARFEQAYSADGGATWEANWIAVDTRG